MFVERFLAVRLGLRFVSEVRFIRVGRLGLKFKNRIFFQFLVDPFFQLKRRKLKNLHRLDHPLRQDLSLLLTKLLSK